MTNLAWGKSIVHRFGKWYCKKICISEYQNQTFRRINERPIEFRFLFHNLLHRCPRSILDVGTGTTALPHLMRNCGFLVTATDNIIDYWTDGMFNRHYHIIGDDITKSNIKGKFDFISCISVLEHVSAFNNAIDCMTGLLDQEGHLILTFPYNEKKFINNIYKHQNAGYGQDLPYICQVFSRKELDYWEQTYQLKIISQEYWQFFTGEYWTIGEQICPPKEVTKDALHQLTCIAFKKVVTT